MRETVPARRKELLDRFQVARVRGACPTPTSASTRPRLRGAGRSIKSLENRTATASDPLVRSTSRLAAPTASRAAHELRAARARRDAAGDGGGGDHRLPADPPLARRSGRADRRRPRDHRRHRPPAHRARPRPAALAPVRDLGSGACCTATSAPRSSPRCPVTQLLAQRARADALDRAADDGARGARRGAARHARGPPRRLVDRPRGHGLRGARLLGPGVPGRLPADLRLRDPPALAAGAGLRAPRRRRRPVAAQPGAAVHQPGAASTWRCSRA